MNGTELINQILQSIDTEEICKMRIPSNMVEDCVAWHYENSGVFTIKSAYKLAYEIKNNATAAASSSSRDAGDRNNWDLIWKARISEKVKIFGWHVATHSLATKQNAFRRTIFKEDMCEICGNEMEDAFRFTGEDWLQMLLDPQSETDRNRTLLLLWQAWHLRNNVLHGDVATLSQGRWCS